MTRDASRIGGLYAIADTACLGDDRLVPAVREAIAGGARVVQYRDKGHDPAARRAQARALVALCHHAGTACIVNDDVELVVQSGADGVHLGREDAPLALARERLGAGALIGVSCYSDLARAQSAVDAGADYVAFGSFFPSKTKPGAARADVELLRHAREALAVPIVAIGGITPENGAALVRAGADALAVIEGLFGQRDIRTTAERYAALFHHPSDS